MIRLPINIGDYKTFLFMKTLIILDPIDKLSQRWDNSLLIGAELISRGHQVWCCDVPDLWALKAQVFTDAKKLIFKSQEPLLKRFSTGSSKIWDVENFNLILIRKEPPVDDAYLYMTYLLEMIADNVKIMNHPRGIRNANEKLWTLNFPKWIPQTVVTAKFKNIMNFKVKNRTPVVKPLNQKGGKDVFILKPSSTARMKKMTLGGKFFIMAQQKISQKKGPGEKRIVLLNGKLLCAYVKKPQKGEFRANLDLGADFSPTTLTSKEKKLIRELKPKLKEEGLDFVGLDVLQEKLLEVNVTCPAGVSEASFLHPHAKLFSAWADFLEESASS